MQFFERLMKTKLTKKQKDDLGSIINKLTIVAVYKGKKKIWTCNGYETPESKKLKITAVCQSIYVRGIVHEILEYLSKNCI